MKKLFSMMGGALVVALTMTACSDDDNNGNTPDPTPQEPAEYTVIIYGMGGGQANGSNALDEDIVPTNINAMTKAVDLYGDKVNAVVNYTFSPNLESLEDYNLYNELIKGNEKSMADFQGKNYRFSIGKGQTLYDLFDDKNQYGRSDADYAEPDSLTNFINWAVENYPAKKYVLVLTDHGGGYVPHTDIPYTPKTRNIMISPTGNSFSVPSLATAIKNAKQRMDVLYFDACLMNCLEVQFEMKDLFDYIVASTFVVPGKGGDYVSLFKLLSNNADLETALKQFVVAQEDYWVGNDLKYTDISVTKTSKLD